MADTEFRRKLEGLQFNRGRNKGRTHTTPVAKDDAPGIAGTTTEDWDGRVSATAINPSITVNPNLEVRRHGD